MTPNDLPPIVTSAQMRAMDDYAVAQCGVSSLALMENAGTSIAEWIVQYFSQREIPIPHVAILCGPGNNGGDGFVIARRLAEAGMTVTVLATLPEHQLKGDARANAQKLTNSKVQWSTLTDSITPPDLTRFDLIVDALYGTGFHGSISGVSAALIDSANRSSVPIVAVDTPSGLDNDTGRLSAPAIIADHTLTLAASKLGQWLWPGRQAVGNLEVVDIGIPESAVRAVRSSTSIIVHDFVSASLPRRPADGHKGTFGTALIVGGSCGMSGAVAMAAAACQRAGAGLCYAATPASLVDAVDVSARETVVMPLPENRRRRSLSTRALGDTLRLTARADAVAIGPGLSTHHETQELVRRLIDRIDKPCVIDADALNACADDTSCLSKARPIPLVLTPHAGEMARLLAIPVEAVVAERMSVAIQAARQFSCVVVMKGAPTFVAGPTGHVYLNPTGNSGMATGGSGDVLTGIIVSLLAQRCPPLDAALAAVYIHGLSGDLAAEELGERSLIATDLISFLPQTFRLLETA